MENGGAYRHYYHYERLRRGLQAEIVWGINNERHIKRALTLGKIVFIMNLRMDGFHEKCTLCMK